MKKFFIVVAILLMAGSVLVSEANAAAMDEGMTRQVWAQSKGRSISTDSSVGFKVWATGGACANPGLGVSSSTSVILYTDYTLHKGITIDTASSSYDTVGEVVDYINTNFATDSSVLLHASIGNDARYSSSTTTLVPANIIACGTSKANTTASAKLQTNTRLSVGVEATEGKINRIKSYSCFLPALPGAGVTIRIYDGDTEVYKKYVSGAAWTTVTADGASNSTVIVDPGGDKGISAGLGNSIMMLATVDKQQVGNSAAELAGTNFSIVYDQF